jgi:RNA polymerase sigma factor (sigma-70 family)
MLDAVPLELRWAARLRDLGRQLHSATDLPSRQDARGEIWGILHLAISRYLRLQARRLGRFTPEDLEDLASQKALELIHRLDGSEWELHVLEVPEIPRILSTVARNALVDRLRQAGRQPFAVKADVKDIDTPASTGVAARLEASPEKELERKEFAEALRRCVERLDVRSRTIWFFRILCEMPTKEIAAHPEIRLKPGHIDVLLLRARKTIRDCMRGSDYEPLDMPPGTFTVLWNTFRLRTAAEVLAPR